MDVAPDERYCPDCGTIMNVLVSTCSFCGHTPDAYQHNMKGNIT